MGPYCNFCNSRCFCHFPQRTPQYILDAYGSSTIIATCRAGQEFEKKKIGYCYDDIVKAIEEIDEIVSGSDDVNPYLLTGEELERTTARRIAGINW